MKKKGMDNIFKGVLAIGTVVGGSAMISDTDVVYAAEFEQSEEAEIVLPSEDEGTDTVEEESCGNRHP